MAKTKISEWSSTPANNTDIDSINIAEGCAPSGINDAIRELMAQVKDLYSGTTGDAIGVAGGGTGQTSYTNGQLLIGNTTGNTLTKATLTAGTGISITNGTGSITIAASGSTYDGFKNRVINGDMRIDQRNAGASITPTNGQFLTDRFGAGVTQASKFTAQQSTTAPTGFINSQSITSSSAYSIGSTDRFWIYQPIEGLNVSDFAWGTASAATVTLSFWVRSSLTGTFGGSLQNGAQNRSYPFSYTISAANTWEQKSITIAGDTSGTWTTTNTTGIHLNIGFGVGASFSGTAGSWASANYFSATGATSVVGTSGATFYITGIQLEKASTASSFDYRDYGRELILCQRYYQQNTVATSGLYGNTVGQVYAGTNIQSGLQLATPMRATPSASIIGTLTWSGGAAGNATVNLSSFGTIYYTPPAMLIGIAGTVASAQTGGYNWTLGSSAGGGYSLSSEL